MKITRHGVFETNSSSSHSLSIADGNSICNDTIAVDNGVVTIHGGEFGWGPEDYHDAPMKAAYAFVYADTKLGDAERRQALTTLKEVIEEHMRAECKFAFADKDEHGNTSYKSDSAYYYIDHQSDGVGAWAFESKETLRRFIFCPYSVLHIDNDNH